jgi:hypothetical protein
MPPWTTNSTKIEHLITKDNHFPPFRQLEGLKEIVNGSCAVLRGGMLEDGGSSWEKKRKMVVVYGGKEEENDGKTACDGHVTRWPFVLTSLTDGRGENGYFW